MKNKIISILLVLMFVMMPVVNYVQATDINNLVSIGKIEPKALSGIDSATIMGVVVWIGYIVATGMVLWVGLKYVISGAGEKAKAKENIIPIIVGALLITTGSTIVSVLIDIYGNT